MKGRRVPLPPLRLRPLRARLFPSSEMNHPRIVHRGSRPGRTRLAGRAGSTPPTTRGPVASPWTGQATGPKEDEH